MEEQIKEILTDYYDELTLETSEEVDRVQRKHPERIIIETTSIHKRVTDKYADQILALFPQGEARWIFKTDKLTPFQVKACVCQQCPFPGEIETKCDWCDNPKMMEFLRLALSAIDDFYQQHEAQALKEQMERVIKGLTKILNQPTDRYIRLQDCNKYIENLKAELGHD